MIRYVLLIIGAALTLALDQWTKIRVASAVVLPDGVLPVDARDIRSRVEPVFEGWFNLRVAGNKGAAWGLFRDLPDDWRVPFFLVIGAVAIVAIVAFYRSAVGQKMLSVALTLILGGALGNLTDRVRLGYVVDFIDWHYGDWHWPTFNIADVAISVGVGLLLLDMLLHRGEPPATADPADAEKGA